MTAVLYLLYTYIGLCVSVHCVDFLAGGHTSETQDLKCPIVSTLARNTIFFTIGFILGLELQPGAAGFQLSNPPVLETVSLLASLNVRTHTVCICYIYMCTCDMTVL